MPGVMCKKYYMKLIPSKKQWHDWTLPSKASYAGLVLAVVFFLASYPTYLYYEHLKVDFVPSLRDGH